MPFLRSAALLTLKVIAGIVGLSILTTVILALPGTPPAFRASHSITIDASPEQVWAVFSDFEKYGEWNPNIPQISGDMQLGSILDMQLVEPPKFEAREYRPTVMIAVPGQHFAWRKHLNIIARFEHHFEVEALADGRSRFHQYEDFGGILCWFLKFKPQHPIHRNPTQSFQRMNQALLERIENRETKLFKPARSPVLTN